MVDWIKYADFAYLWSVYMIDMSGRSSMMDSSFVDSEIFPSRYGYCRFLVDYSYLVSCTCLIDIFEVSCWLCVICECTWVLVCLIGSICWLYSWHMCIFVMWVLFEGYCWFYLRWYMHTGSVYIVGGITVIYTYDVSIFGVY